MGRGGGGGTGPRGRERPEDNKKGGGPRQAPEERRKIRRVDGADVALCPAGQARANILVVDDDNVPCFSAPYHNINAALAVAEAGDEIDVCPGLYSEQVVLTKVLTLRGMPVGSQKAVIMPPALPASRPSTI